MSERQQFGDLRKGTFSPRAFVILRTILLFTCRIVLGMKIEGLDRVPRTGPLLIVTNHLHNADAVFISIACPRPLHFMAKEELMRIPVIGRLIRLGGAFPVARGKADRTAIRRAVATLDQGIALGMFPEGTRSKSWHMEKALTGAGLVAIMGKALIQPVAITGSETLPFNDVKGRKTIDRDRPWHLRPRIRIVFGEPFAIPATTAEGGRMTAETATNLMMRGVAELLPEHYRGVYGNQGVSS